MAYALLLLVLGASWPFGTNIAAAEQTQKLTVQKAVELAKTGNPSLLAAESRVRQEQGRLVQAQSSRLPRVTLSLGFQGLNEALTYHAYDKGGTPIGIVPAGYEKTYQAALTLKQVLYSGGTITSRIQAEEFLVLARQAERDRVAQRVENGAQAGYYGLQRAIAREAVALEALNLAEEHLEQVKIFHRTGVVAKNEVLRVQVAVSTAQLNVIEARSHVQVAWKQLERVTGHSLEGNYIVAAGDSELTDLVVDEDPLSRALAMRPELKALAASEKAARKMVQAAKGQYLPQVGLTVEGRLYDDTFFPSQNEELLVGIRVELPLMDSGQIHGQIVEHSALAEELLYGIEDMKREIALDVSKTKVSLDSALQKVLVAGDGVVQAEEDYRMALKRYQANVGTNIDVLDARLALIDTRNAKIDAIAEARTAYADLIYAMGDR
ncbi:MAG: TolC family protein [Fretibacterium sp.]|nr:TolC family protein [Fretibacterium sp.]